MQLCLLACLICAAIIVSGLRYHNNLYYRYGYLNNELNYCLAMAVIGLVSELVFFILYLVGATRSCTGQAFAIIVSQPVRSVSASALPLARLMVSIPLLP